MIARRSLDLAGRVAFVTGGAHGIGFATATGLCARGAVVTIVDTVEAEAAAARIGDATLGLAADATDPDSLARAVEATVASFGGLDVVVANAGIPPPIASMRSVDPAAFERVVEVNLLGVWRTVRAALPVVLERRGHIVVVASVYAFMPGVLAASYAASKAAVESLGRSLRIELAPYGVTATTAEFGFVRTSSFEKVLADPAAARFERCLPRWMRRRIEPAEAAAVIIDGIERRRARVSAPRRWELISLLRGASTAVVDPMIARHPVLRQILVELDGQPTTTTPTTTASPLGDRT